jgi:hypothetical protein
MTSTRLRNLRFDLPQLEPRTAERRECAARAALARRIQREFEEMPGMSLTTIQAGRLFAISSDVCARILVELRQVGVLRCRHDGQYVLNRAVA